MDFLNYIPVPSVPAIICFILGFLLVIFEMFHPGIQISGVAGVIFLVIGIFLTAHTWIQALVFVILIVAILGIALALVIHSATKGHLSKNLVLTEAIDNSNHYNGKEDMDFFINKEGVALTTLRPSGTVNFDGVKLDVVSEGEFIQCGSKVRVMKIEGMKIVVREEN